MDDVSRKRGRPSNEQPRQPEIPVVVAEGADPHEVRTIYCPGCGSMMKPKVERWRGDGRADAICTAPKWQFRPQDACRIVYTPGPMARLKK